MTKETIDKDKYISILGKVNHKPIIIESIFSYIKYNPYILFKLVEKDKILASSLNSYFKPIKKNNNLSKTLNDNIKILLFYKQFKEYITGYFPDDIYLYEKEYSENTTDPSFINFKLNLYLEKVFDKNS